MAVHHRNTASSLTQEAPLITRVALYARVSTCNGQDPEMQLRCRRGLPERHTDGPLWWSLDTCHLPFPAV